MPKGSKMWRMEQHLKDSAAKQGLKGDEADNMVYGVMNKYKSKHTNMADNPQEKVTKTKKVSIPKKGHKRTK